MQADDELVASFIAREPAGLSRAYERYATELVSVARHVLGDAGAAEDCVHDALLRVWRTRDSFRPERGALRSFLIACVRNEAMTALRGAARRRQREERAHHLEAPDASEVNVVDFIEAARVRAALRRLPDEQRIALEHAYFRNRSQSEIAAELGVPLGTIKSRILLGMRKLATELAPLGGVTP